MYTNVLSTPLEFPRGMLTKKTKRLYYNHIEY